MNIRLDHELLGQKSAGAWHGFLPGIWQSRVKLRDFILQRIYRLLGVGNGAHALARCLELRLLEG